MPQHKDSINDTHNEGGETTPVREGLYSPYVREPTPDDAEEEHVAETIRIVREQQKAIKGHLSRQDQVMTELKQPLSGASNNTNRRAQFLSAFKKLIIIPLGARSVSILPEGLVVDLVTITIMIP